MITSILALAGLAIGASSLEEEPLKPAAAPSPAVRIQGGVTFVGYQVDSAPFAKEFGRFPWRAVWKPVRGRSWILSRDGEVRPGRYWLSDEARMTGSIQPAGQIVQVIGGRGERLELDEPISIEFRSDARIVAVPIAIDVVLEGGSGPISVGLTDGFRIGNWTVEDRWDRRGLARAISIQSSRRGKVENVEVGASGFTSAGMGYACQVQRSLDIRIERLKATRVRHAGNVFGGARITFADSRGVETAYDAFETHGYGAREVRFERCDFGGSNASFGNKYPWGDVDVALVDCTNVKTLFVYGAVANARAVRTKFSGPLVLATNEAGRPISATMVDCDFTGFLDQGQAHSAGVRLMGRGGIEKLSLIDCTIRDFAGRHARAIYIGDVDEATLIVIERGSLGDASGDYAIEVDNSGHGEVVLEFLGRSALRYRKDPVRTQGTRSTRVSGIGVGEIWRPRRDSNPRRSP